MVFSNSFESPVLTNVSYEQMRSLMVETLSSSMTGQTSSLHSNTFNLAKQKNLITVKNTSSNNIVYSNSGYNENSWPQKYRIWIDDIFWDLMIEGIVRPGLGDSINNDLPWYHVSEYGKKVINTEPQPYDPDKFIERVKSISDVDNVIVMYLEESLKAFRIQCLLSSVITLGCASEKAILVLIEACENAIVDQQRKTAFSKATNTISIKKKHDELSKIIETKIWPNLSYDEKTNLETYLSGLFTVIRNYRNDAGHPSGTIIEREHLYALLVTFPIYLEKIYFLIDWLKSNTI